MNDSEVRVHPHIHSKDVLTFKEALLYSLLVLFSVFIYFVKIVMYILDESLCEKINTKLSQKIYEI